MVPYGRVDPYENVGHEGVVGDVAVALVVRRHGPGGAPVVAVPRAHDAVDAAAVPFHDLRRGVSLDRAAEGVADRRADEGARDPVFERRDRRER